MTINEREGKSRNRASIDYAALNFSLNLCLFSAQGVSLNLSKTSVKKQTKHCFWLHFSFVFTVLSVHINNYFVVSNLEMSDYIFQTGHAFVLRGCSEPTLTLIPVEVRVTSSLLLLVFTDHSYRCCFSEENQKEKKNNW